MINSSELFINRNDFRPRFRAIVDLCSKNTSEDSKNICLFTVLLSHELSQANQTETDLLIEYGKVM